MLRFGETKVAEEKFYAAKKVIKIWDVDLNNIVISKLIKTKTNSKYLIGHLDRVMRPLVLILPKVDMFKLLKLKMEIKITINWCIYKEMMTSH